MENLLTPQELADRFKCSVITLKRWRKERKGPRFIKEGKFVRYHPKDVDDWEDRHRRGGYI